jgi:hypothetical protein
MKRYLIFAAVGPFFGGLLLFAATVASGYSFGNDNGRRPSFASR